MAGTHKSFKSGSSMSLVYLVIVSFVTEWMTPLQTSSMLMLCWNWSRVQMKLQGEGVAGRIVEG